MITPSILIIFVLIVSTVYMFYLHAPIKHFFTRKSLYKYEHIPGYGEIPYKYEWHKTDIDALNSEWAGWADFIEQIYPNDIRIKPKK